MSHWRHMFLLCFGAVWLLLQADVILGNSNKNFSDPSFGCPSGWYRHGNSCFLFSKHPFVPSYSDYDAWLTATKTCISKDADLATANTLERLQFLTSNAHAMYTSYIIDGIVLLGSRDRLKVVWKWYEGQAINVSLWGIGVPDNLKCGSLFSKHDWCGWWWLDTPCNRRYGYICERQLASSNCSLGYLKIANTCYKINLAVKRKWLDAHTSCIREGAKLAVVDNEEKRLGLSKELDSLKLSRYTKVFIGLVRDMTIWSWIDGQPVNQSLFQVGKTILRQSYDQCIALDASKSVNTGLVATKCNFYYSVYISFICEKKEVNIAQGTHLAHSLSDNSGKGQYVVDGKYSTCFQFSTDINTWFKVQLGKKSYVYKVVVTVLSNKNQSKSTFEVKVDSALRYSLFQPCLSRGFRGQHLFFECKPIVHGSALTISSNRHGFTLNICEIEVYGFDSSAGIVGVLREVWVDQRDEVKSLKEFMIFHSVPDSTRILKTFEMTYQLGRNILQRFSSYVRVFENGEYLFLITCKIQCEISLDLVTEQAFQNKTSGGDRSLLHLRHQTRSGEWSRQYRKHLTPITLSVCHLYHVNTYVKENYVTVGVKYPDGKLNKPIPNKHLYWTQPGERTFRFKMLPESDAEKSIEVGKRFKIRGSYRYCCHGIQCPNCTLNLQFHGFKSSLTINPSVPMDCKEYLWSTTKQATVQPGNYSLEISYHFLQDNNSAITRRAIGYILVKETKLLQCGFRTKDICGWKRNTTTKEIQWEKPVKGNFLALNNSLHTAYIESISHQWNSIYQMIGVCLSFKYQLMSHKAEFEVYVSSKEELKRLWRLKGFHGYVWDEALASWRPQRDIKLIFKGVGKVAVSDVLVTTSMCSTKPNYAKPGYRCSEEHFQCDNLQCINKVFKCDGDKACVDGSDEIYCVCPSNKFQCPSGRCLLTDDLCNHRDDCRYHRTDEKTCGRRNNILQFQCVDGTYVPWSVTCQEGAHCKDGSHYPDICGTSRCPLNNLTCKENSKRRSRCNSALPVLCSFDDESLCSLTSDIKDKFKWTKSSGGTPTQYTGPSFDHTTLSKSGSYLHIEASNVSMGAKARLYSRWFEANQPICLHFWYHMFGAHVGSLNIIEMTNTTTTKKWSQHGDKGNRWLFGQVTLVVGKPFKFIVEGVRGNGVYGDIAIDDLGIIDGACAMILEQTSPNCDFQSDQCGWYGDKEWSLSKSITIPGISPPETGGFLYLLRQQSSYITTKSISSPPLRLLDGWKCVVFSYYIGATDSYFTRELTLLIQNKNGSSIEWGTPYSTNKWIYVQVPFTVDADGNQVTFKVKLSHSVVVAIDDVSFSKTNCDVIPYHTGSCSVLTHGRDDLKCCSFPFIYEEMIHYTCDTTGQSDPQPWCSVTQQYEYYDYCDGYCPWKTVDDTCCSFPFHYNGHEYSSCITLNTSRPWCKTNKNEWGFCRGDCDKTEELCWWKSQQNRTKLNWSVISPSDVYREITNIAKNVPNQEKEELFEVQLPASQFGNLTVNLAIDEKIQVVTLCFWMRSQSRGLSILYKVPDGCKMTVGIGIHSEENVVLTILGHSMPSKFSVNNGAWHHVCLTWRSAGGRLKGYIDGRVVLREKPDEIDGFLIAGGGTLIASIVDTNRLNSQDVMGRVSGINLWSREMNEFEVLRMSVGCGHEKGDLLPWDIIVNTVKGSTLKIAPAGCLFNGADHFIFATNSSRPSSILQSPWYNRSAVGHTQCLRFRYIIYGPGAVQLRVMHRHDSNQSFVPVLSVVNNNKSPWGYAEASVGSVGKLQLSMEASFNQSNGFIAISALYILDGQCSKQPRQHRAFKVILTQRSGIVTSPFHPGNYHIDTTYNWVISAPKYHVIRLYILAFDLEYHVQCAKDYLEVFDGASVTSTRIGRFCGDTYPAIIESSGNDLTVRFHSDIDVVKSGFKLTYIWRNIETQMQCASKGCPLGTKCYLTSESKKVILESQRHQPLEVIPLLPQQASILLFAGNRISKLTKYHFDSLSTLEYIDLSGNLIFNTESLAFTDMPSIKVIRLNGNFIRSFPKFSFLPALHTLDLGENMLSNVTKYSLKNLSSLYTLSLRMNRIDELEDEMFANMVVLHYLDSQNSANSDTSTTCCEIGFSLPSIKTNYYLDNNNIKKITRNTFKGLKSLQILHLQNNQISEKDVTSDVFENLRNLKQLKLDNFILCCYAKTSLNSGLLSCESSGNEFSSCEDMMKNNAIRVCLWILGIIASLGNILVIIWRFKVRDENKVQSLLLTNLAVSDFIMGIYLLILAVKDSQFKGQYYKYDVQWRAGMSCQLTGALSMLSSEASVLTLTVITADRLISVVFAFRVPRLSLKVTSILCILIWSFCFVISFLPIFGLDYFRDDLYGFGFYGRSTVCLPLQLSSHRAPGWEYSIAFFIFLNFAAFLFILVSYCAIFWTILRMSRASATKHMRKESSKAARLFFIIFTDFCCWMPVIILGLLSLTNSFHDRKSSVYVWIAVFVLPLNSSVNPILYTFSTDYVKRHIVSLSLFSSFTFRSNSRSRSRTVEDVSLKEMEPSNSNNFPKVKVTCHEPDFVEELKIIEECNIFPRKNLNESVGFVLAETNSKEKVLVKYFSENGQEDWKREVAVQSKLKQCGSHENVLTYKWNADSACSSPIQHEKNVSSITSSWLICYIFPSSKTLRDFCEKQGGFDVLCNVVLDVVTGLEYLHGNGICHDFINDLSVLIEDKNGIPTFKAVIGDFRNAFVLHNYPESEACVHKLNDVKQLGLLIDGLITTCNNEPVNEIRDLSKALTSDCNSAEILSCWRQKLLDWDFSSTC